MMNHDDTRDEEKGYNHNEKMFYRWLVGELKADLSDVIQGKGE